MYSLLALAVRHHCFSFTYSTEAASACIPVSQLVHLAARTVLAPKGVEQYFDSFAAPAASACLQRLCQRAKGPKVVITVVPLKDYLTKDYLTFASCRCQPAALR